MVAVAQGSYNRYARILAIDVAKAMCGALGTPQP
jgi:hypothetical protein